MRLPLKGTDYFSKKVNSAFEDIQAEFLEAVKPAIAMQKSHAMLGDGTVTQTDTFDPQNVQTFYQRLTNRMEGWLAGGISKSVTDDLHRLFCQFNKDVGKYYISGYFGIQFHALPYYKADKRVIEVQKELAKIADDATALYGGIRDNADKALGQELEKRGLAEMDFEGLFSKMFEDEKLAEELDKKAASVEGQAEFQKMGERKNALFAELNDLMIELYQTSAVPIDYNRLMQGEEGVCTYFDIELIKKGSAKKAATRREATFETVKVPKADADKVAGEIASVAKALKKAK